MSTSPDADASIEARLLSLAQTHPAMVAFREEHPSATEHRQVLNFQPEHLPTNFTATTIAGPGMVYPRPYLLADDASGAVLVLFHLGQKLAGHAGIVHGGVPAVLLDEVMGRACFPLLTDKIGVTVTLDMQYKSPTPVDSVVLMKAVTREVKDGRKAWVDAVVEDAAEPGTVRVEAKACSSRRNGRPAFPKYYSFAPRNRDIEGQST